MAIRSALCTLLLAVLIAATCTEAGKFILVLFFRRHNSELTVGNLVTMLLVPTRSVSGQGS